MTKSVEDKLLKIPILNWLVRIGKSIKIPGLQGMSLYDIIEMYIIGIVKGALTSRAGGIAFSFFMALFPFLLFILTLIPYVPVEGFQADFLFMIKQLLPSPGSMQTPGIQRDTQPDTPTDLLDHFTIVPDVIPARVFWMLW